MTQSQRPFDRKAMLEEIAANPSISPASRLRAVRLIEAHEPKPERPPPAPKPDLTIGRAIELMRELHTGPDAIPCQGEHRRVPLHGYQPPDRVRRIVLPGIDRILDGPADPVLLFELAADLTVPPECRLLASARFMAMVELRVTAHEAAPKGLANVQARVAGLSSITWVSPPHYCSLLDVWTGPSGPPARPARYRRELEACQSRSWA